ncbi:MAG: anti-sigma factor family protein [Actinomycetes bacterium]
MSEGWGQAAPVEGSGDPYAGWDAAYVLGALSPAERRAYEEHLAGCPACQKAVAEIAGLPGLLGQVTPEEAAILAGEADSSAPPSDLLPAALRRAQARRRRIRLLTGLAAAVVLVVGVLGGLGSQGWGPFAGTDEPYRVAFVPLQPSAMTAVADVVPQEDGTSIQVECAYSESNAPRPGGAYAQYEIWVTDRSGTEKMAKSWPSKPNRKMRPEAYSPLPESRIDHLEIRSAAGERLLRADLR